MYIFWTDIPQDSRSLVDINEIKELAVGVKQVDDFVHFIIVVSISICI